MDALTDVLTDEVARKATYDAFVGSVDGVIRTQKRLMVSCVGDDDRVLRQVGQSSYLHQHSAQFVDMCSFAGGDE